MVQTFLFRVIQHFYSDTDAAAAAAAGAAAGAAAASASAAASAVCTYYVVIGDASHPLMSTSYCT